MHQCERRFSKNPLQRIYGKLIDITRLNSDFSRPSRKLNTFLGIFKVRLCKDCQTITSAKDLRCYDCRIDHNDYLREKIASDLQYEDEEYEEDYYD